LGIVGLAGSTLLASGAYGIAGFCLGLWLYFTAFNYLEAALPSLVSKAVYAGGKGTALGVYTTFQFLGAFAGGGAGGVALQMGGVGAVLGLCAVVALLWLPLAVSMRPPRDLINLSVRLPPGEGAGRTMLSRIRSAEGVADMLVIEEERTVYLKVDPDRFDATLVEPGERQPELDGLPRAGGQTA
jgi:MFS family permease